MKKFFILASSVILFMLLSPTFLVYATDYSSPDVAWKPVYSTSSFITVENVRVSTSSDDMYWHFRNTSSVLHFKFYGSRLRVIGSTNTGRPSNNRIVITNDENNVVVDTTFSVDGDYQKYSLLYEVSNLDFDNYTVDIYCGSTYTSPDFYLLRFDINDDGVEGFYTPSSTSDVNVDMSDTNNKLDYIYGGIIWFCIVALAIFFLVIFYKILCYFF